MASRTYSLKWARYRPLLFGASLIAIALVGATIQWRHLVLSQARPVSPTPTLSVVVARTAIPPDSPIIPADLTVVPELATSVPPSHYTSIQALTGAWSTEAIAPGVVVTSAAVMWPGRQGPLAAAMPANTVAVDVPLAATVGDDGTIVPGDFIDLAAEVSNPKTGTHTIGIVMSHIPVLAVNGSLTAPNPPTTGQSIQVLVAVSRAQALTLTDVESNATQIWAWIDSTKTHQPVIPTPQTTWTFESGGGIAP